MSVTKGCKLRIFLVSVLVPLAVLTAWRSGETTEIQMTQPFLKLVPQDSWPIDYAGTAVAISGNVAVVGAPNAWRSSFTSGDGRGAAYVFRNNGTTWVQEQKLVAPDAALRDHFGSAVAVAPGIIFVGAAARGPRDSYQTGTGAVYVFRYNGTSWVHAQQILAVDGDAGDAFGYSIATDGNVLLVGAGGDSDVIGNGGSAYVFRFNGQTWVQEQKFYPVNPGIAESFGLSVSVSNGLAVVGAYQNDSMGPDAGAAYVYKYNGTIWVQQTKLTASDAKPGQAFGYSVSVSDGVALIGAYKDYPYCNYCGMMAGAAYVYRFNAASQQWVEEAKLLEMSAPPPSSEVGNMVGYSVAISGNTAVIGEPYWEDRSVQYPARDQGGALVFTYDLARHEWLLQTRLMVTGMYNDYLGKAVAISGNVVLAGSANNDASGMDSGTGYLFDITRPPSVCVSDLNSDDQVNATDLGILLGNWGSPGCQNQSPCAADVDGNGAVNANDLSILLGNWGSTCS